MAEGTEHRKLAAIMFTDMVGYSALAQKNEALALELLEEHRLLLRAIFPKHQGNEIKTTGDGFLVEFPSALAAVRCGIAIQEAITERNARSQPHELFRIRIGIHVGDVVWRDGDVHGDGVNIAARIEPLADPGGICISEDVARQIQNKIGHAVIKIGPGELKNIRMPVMIYKLGALKEPNGGAPQPAAARRSPLRLALLGAGAVLVALAVFLPSRFKQTPPPASTPTVQAKPTAPAATTNQQRLAVLPLKPVGTNEENIIFAEGMTVELISKLGRVAGLRIKDGASYMRSKGAGKDHAEVGKELGVGSVLAGNILKEGTKLRIRMQLVDVESQETIRTFDFDREWKDLFLMQTEVAEGVAAALKVQLGAGEKARMARNPTENLEAYSLYLTGRHHLDRRSAAGMEKARELFQQTILKDPTFAPGHAGLSDVLIQSFIHLGQSGWEQHVKPARALLRKALELDDTLAAAHASLGFYHSLFELDLPRAESELLRAIELDPNCQQAYYWYSGHVLSKWRRFEEALRFAKAAEQMDPENPSCLFNTGYAFLSAGDLAGAVTRAKKILELAPDHPLAGALLGQAYLRQGRNTEAIALFERIPNSSGRGMLGAAYAKAGRTDDAKRVYEELRASGLEQFRGRYGLASIEVALGQTNAAISTLETMSKMGEGIFSWSNSDPSFDGLREEPGFKALMKKAGLEWPVQK